MGADDVGPLQVASTWGVEVMPVYLIHFDRPYKHARHYIGFVEDAEGIEARMQRHEHGNGSRLMAVITQAGIPWRLVRVWPEGDRSFERRLKNRKKSKQLCPICNESLSKYLADAQIYRAKEKEVV
ncbi:hypothetical protein LLG46_02235 [bacterium]|nr:hypothetical protein [bacterium]